MLLLEILEEIEQTLPEGFALRQVKSLQKNFKPNKDRDFEKAIWVIISLYALDREELIVNFINSFIDEMGESNRGFQLGNKQDALATLAYFLRRGGFHAEAKSRIEKYISLVDSLSAGECCWYYEQARDVVKHYYENEQLKLEVSIDSTKNDIILGHLSTVREILNYYSIVEFLDKKGQQEIIPAFDDIIEIERSRLAEKLLL
ncbi:hypothetical protein DLR60_01440 [Vibrio tarriae]|uniref:hypothetical protein n=1 Tax=Vibrio tarriae TaxID=2014742 RepID=UPI000DE49784|nr:hypothetical protein [Vibrio tarriae]RBM71168.1 hypothetical protein DLR60_01440 [Vibrio tarriae]